MAPLPDHITARREQAQARRRRQRWTVLGVVVVVAALAVAFAAVSLGGSSASQHHGSVTATHNATPTSLPVRGRKQGLSAIEARGDRNIRKLAALALPIFCGGPHGNEVAFTFDDGPGPYTHYAVKKLTQAHERATFFVVGKSMNAYPGWLPRELKVAALGDHTETHADLLELPLPEVATEISQAKQLIERQSGQPVVLFRPPYAAHNAAVDQIIKQFGLLDIIWSVDSGDSEGANYAGIIKNVEAGLRPGAIIGMHENRGQTIRALTTLLPVLHRLHLRSVSLPELFGTDPPSVAQVRRGQAACYPGEKPPPMGAGA